MLDLQKPYSQMTTDELAELQMKIAKYIAFKAREEAVGKEPDSIFDQWDETSGKDDQQAERDRIVAQARKDISDLIEHACGEFLHTTFIANEGKRTIVALLKDEDTGEIRARGIAKCNQDDCFNDEIGEVIALIRALGEIVPEEYLFATQPTEVRVGDVVEYYGNIGIVDERSVKAYNNAEGVKIIDDSDSTPPEGDNV